MSSNTCVIVSAMFMYGGVTVIVSREILANNLCKRLLHEYQYFNAVYFNVSIEFS